MYLDSFSLWVTQHLVDFLFISDKIHSIRYYRKLFSGFLFSLFFSFVVFSQPMILRWACMYVRSPHRIRNICSVYSAHISISIRRPQIHVAKALKKGAKSLVGVFRFLLVFFFFGKLIRFSKQKENIHKFNKNTI